MKQSVSIRIPEIWGDATFERDEWGDLNFLIGPNGTGKSLFAEKLEQGLGRSTSVRYLSADRLSGMVEPNTTQFFSMSRSADGLDISRDDQLQQQAKRRGYSADAYLLLRNKPDLRIRVQAILSEYFDRDIELTIEGGYLDPTMIDKRSLNTYNLRENESHGLKELIALLAIMYDDDPDIIIIDEPELHLHPQYQTFLLQEIQSLTQPRKDDLSKTFFIVTHSPSMLDFRSAEDMLNTLSFRDSSKPPFVVDDFTDNDKYHIDRLLPRLETQHKEALFSRKPILVEGYTDKQIFSMIISKHTDLRRDPSSTIVSLGGKENVNSFFRFCQELGLNPRIIADLDILFNGNLRETLAERECVNSRTQNHGFGSDLMDGVGSIETAINKLINDIVNENGGSLEGPLLRAKEYINRVEDGHKRRYVLYRAICADEQAAHSKFGKGRVRNIQGRMTNILRILGECGYHILDKGELEDYLSEDAPLEGVSQSRKSEIFHEARNNLTNANGSSEVADAVNGLMDVLSNALGTREVDFVAHMKEFVSQWIHNVQMAIAGGEIKSKEELKNHPNLGEEKYSRLFSVQVLNIHNHGFNCTIKINPSLDPDEAEVEFKDDTVPSKISLGEDR